MSGCAHVSSVSSPSSPSIASGSSLAHIHSDRDNRTTTEFSSSREQDAAPGARRRQVDGLEEGGPFGPPPARHAGSPQLRRRRPGPSETCADAQGVVGPPQVASADPSATCAEELPRARSARRARDPGRGGGLGVHRQVAGGDRHAQPECGSEARLGIGECPPGVSASTCSERTSTGPAQRHRRPLRPIGAVQGSGYRRRQTPRLAQAA